MNVEYDPFVETQVCVYFNQARGRGSLEYRRILPLAEQWLKQEPENIEAHHRYARCLSRSGLYFLAVEACREMEKKFADQNVELKNTRVTYLVALQKLLDSDAENFFGMNDALKAERAEVASKMNLFTSKRDPSL